MADFRPDRLESERAKMGWTQEQVAEKIGVARSTYGNYEAGKREPDLKALKNMSKLFEVSTDYLSGNSDIRNTAQLDLKTEKLIASLEKLNSEQLDHLLKTIEILSAKD